MIGAKSTGKQNSKSYWYPPKSKYAFTDMVAGPQPISDESIQNSDSPFWNETDDVFPLICLAEISRHIPIKHWFWDIILGAPIVTVYLIVSGWGSSYHHHQCAYVYGMISSDWMILFSSDFEKIFEYVMMSWLQQIMWVVSTSRKTL